MKKFVLLLATLLFSAFALAAVNINTATKEELDALPEIGPVKAQAIVDYRNANGPFKTPEDVMKVNGIKEGTFGKIKGMISVSGASTPAAMPAPMKAESKAAPAAMPAPMKAETKAAPAKDDKMSKAEMAKADKAKAKEDAAMAAKAKKDAKVAEAKAKKDAKAAEAKAKKDAKAAKDDSTKK